MRQCAFVSEVMIVVSIMTKAVKVVAITVVVSVVMAMIVVGLVPPIFNLLGSWLGKVRRNEQLLLLIFILPELERDISWLMLS